MNKFQREMRWKRLTAEAEAVDEHRRVVGSLHNQAALALVLGCKIGLQERVPQDQATACCGSGSPALPKAPLISWQGKDADLRRAYVSLSDSKSGC